jgi:signal transduction histidine kinase
MKLKSLRFQLPLSYAAIALLAALTLGAVLLFTLRRYYQDQERTYSQENAQAIGLAVAQMLELGIPDEVIAAQLQSFSFLTLARIQVWDDAGASIADTGIPKLIRITSLAGDGGPTKIYVSRDPLPLGEGPASQVMIISSGGSGDGDPLLPFDQLIYPAPEALAASGQTINGFVTPLGRSLYGFDLSPAADDIERSTQSVSVLLVNTGGVPIGKLQLSDGPAYGRQIVNSVAWAWAVSGLLAVLLAAGAGGLVSRRVAAPVLALTAAAGRMAAGDLSARADVAAPAELAVLGHTFNEMAVQVGGMLSTLRNFVSDAAHELHTPLTALRTDLELSAANPSTELAQRALGHANRLQGLVESLLDLSRLEAETNRADEPVDLAALVREMGEIHASRAEQVGLTFTLEVPEGVVEIRGSAGQLRSAVGNLLENAVKFTPEGGAIRLGLTRDGKNWEVWVEDTGIGIPEEELPLLFRRFHRGRNVSRYPGNGLGLAIVQAVAQAHGGEASVQRLAQGTRAGLRLPGLL